MVTLSAFADEIAPDLEEQLRGLEAEGIRYLELRSVWGKNVKDLTDDEVARIQTELERRGIGVSAIGSPLGKIGINDDFEAHLADLRRIIAIARALKTAYIRIFSFFIPQGEKPETYREKALARLRTMLAVTKLEAPELTLLHENEKEIYGDTGARCLEIMEEISDANFAAIFDPANFVQVGEHPYGDCFLKLKPYIRYFHVKDALLADGRVVPAGEGDGDLRQIFGEFLREGFSGFMSLEPHLAVAERHWGFSGAERFHVAAEALKRLLKELGAEYA